MCVRNILERHWRPELGIAFEHLDDQFKPFRPDPITNHRVISGWHSVQAAWMVMNECLRTGHRDNFMAAMEMGRIMLEKCWYDDGKEKGLTSLANPEAKPQLPSGGYTAWGALDDAMVFTLLSIEHTQAPWAVDWFKRGLHLGVQPPGTHDQGRPATPPAPSVLPRSNITAYDRTRRESVQFP